MSVEQKGARRVFVVGYLFIYLFLAHLTQHQMDPNEEEKVKALICLIFINMEMNERITHNHRQI